MQRILYISGYQIFPPLTGGHIRAANIIRGLAMAGCEIRIYALCGRRQDYRNHLASSVTHFEDGVSEYVYRGLLRGIVQGLFQRLQLVHFWQTFLGRKNLHDPRLLQDIHWADTIVINHSYAYTFLRLATQKNRIINSHNLEHDIWADSWWKRKLVSPLIKRMEIRAAHAADTVWCCAPNEEIFYKKANPTIKTCTVPNGVFPDVYQKCADIRARLRAQLGISDWQRVILFVGSNYAPNRAAFKFIQDFTASHPAFLSAHGFMFLVAGSVTKAPTRAKHLITTGFVDDLVPYFQAADFAINPVASGSGTNIKNFEYIAAHLPILSTPFGVRGFDLKNEEDFFEFDLSALKKTLENGPLGMSAAQLETMARSAFQKNRAILDIGSICKQLTKQTYQDA